MSEKISWTDRVRKVSNRVRKEGQEYPTYNKEEVG